MRVVAPLAGIEDVLRWQPGASGDHTVSRTPLAVRAPSMHPKMLVCHDMKGGYLEDALVDGVWAESDSNADADGALASNAPYRLRHFALADYFVYFSHARVSIPPPGWTDACHVNGVMCLGTLLTEWDEGAVDLARLLASSSQVADQLARIACHLGFDGWLVNIENALPDAAAAASVAAFVGNLRRSLVRLVPHGRVVWYDSVVSDGALKWQNHLNEHNEQFFHECDLFFTNYSWKADEPAISTQNAGSRHKDILTGIDVWGRNTLFGGNESGLGVAHCFSAGTGVALFAPAWTHEVGGPVGFEQRDDDLWTAGKDSIAAHVVARPHSLGAGGAFGTTFGDGFGLQFACALGSGGAWFSLSLTSPSALPGACVEHCNDAFFGGACVASIGKPFLAVSVEPTRSSLRFSVALSGASLSLSSSDASFDFTSLFGAHGWRTANVSARPTGVADWTAVSGELVREPGCTDDVILLRAASGARVGGAALWDEATWELRSDDGVTCAAKDGRAMLSGVAAERVGDHVVVSFVHEFASHGGIVVFGWRQEGRFIVAGAARQHSAWLAGVPRGVREIECVATVLNGCLVDGAGPIVMPITGGST